MEAFSMIGSPVPHDRILNKSGQGKGGRYISRPECGSLRQSSTKTPAEASNYNTEQLAPVKRYVEFLQLKELQWG
jgi:hypothetical protein